MRIKTRKKGSKISTDGIKAYQAQCVTKDYFHEFEKMDHNDSGSNLKWLHVLISNAKAFILGTFHGLARFDLQSYLDEFCYRFNRRNIPQLMFDKLINSALLTPPLGHYSAGGMG
ncbi:MAG: transposase [Ruminococcus sp.]|nr:transposase [Ruminococcus sp.]